MKTILVTGATGFIGRNLVEYLSEDFKVLSPTHRELDLTDTDEVSMYFKLRPKIDAVIHCAGKETHPCFTANVKMIQNVRQFAQCKVLFMGSGADNRLDGYGMSKHVMVNCAKNTKNTSYFRLYGVFGKYEDFNRRFISVCILKKLKDECVFIESNRTINYIYIDDVCQMVKNWIKTRKIYSVYIPMHPESKTLKQIAEIVGVTHLIGDWNGDKYYPNKHFNPLLKKYTPLDKAIEKLYGYYKRKNIKSL